MGSETGIASFILAAVLTFSFSSSASMLGIDPPDEYVRAADLIALVEVTQRREVRCSVDGLERVCGWVYKAKVIDSVKGPSADLEFYSGLPPENLQSPQLVVLLEAGPSTFCKTITGSQHTNCEPIGDYQLHRFQGAVSEVVATSAKGDVKRLVSFGEPDSWFWTDDFREVTTDAEGKQFVTWEYMRSSILRWLKAR